MILTVFFYIFVAIAVIQLCYYLSFLSFLLHKPISKNDHEVPSVSVLVCAKNEAENLEVLIPLLLEQEHPKFELILINDASTDNTLEIMHRFKQYDSRIKVVNVENNEAFWGNKKYALTLGIKTAKYNHLLFTDADCIPNSNQWITKMSQQFSQKKSIVLGYGKYKVKRNSLLNLLVRYETLLAAVQYFSYAKLNSPYMAVGRNLAYTKEEFYRVKGFINHMQIPSGDDDLFIKDAATRTNTEVCLDSDSFTLSEAPNNFTAWFRQKRRHVSTSSYYKRKHQFFLGLFFITKMSFLALSPVLLFLMDFEFVLPVVIFYVLINYLVIGFSARKLKERQIIYFLPFLEIFLILFQMTIFIANSISKPTHWK